MGNAVKIRQLVAPQMPLSNFDPGEYLSTLEFFETDSAITDEDRDGLAQVTHFLAFLALQSRSNKWADSTVPQHTLAYRALDSHFRHLAGWEELSAKKCGLNYRELASFLMPHYPPRRPKS